MNKKEEKIVEALQEIERITQMQFDNAIYLKNGLSIYPHVKMNSTGDDEKDYSNLFFTGTYTDYDELEKVLDIDLNGCTLEEVVETLICHGLIKKKYVNSLTGNSYNFDILFD